MIEPDSSKYTYDGHEWTHSCKGQPVNMKMFWDGFFWWLRTRQYDYLCVDWCPWCGLELEAMPKEEEQL